MSDLKTVLAHIEESAHYSGVSYAAIVESAVETESLTDKTERATARVAFKKHHGLTSIIWARVAERCPDFRQLKRDGIRAVAFMCQLPEKEFNEMFDAHRDHLDEPNAHLLVMRDVDDVLERKRAERKPRRDRAKRETGEDALRQAVIDAACRVDGLPWDLILKPLPEHRTAIVALGDALAELAALDVTAKAGAK